MSSKIKTVKAWPIFLGTSCNHGQEYMFLPPFLYKGDLWRTSYQDTHPFPTRQKKNEITQKAIHVPYYKGGMKQGEKTFYTTTRSVPSKQSDIGGDGSAPLPDLVNRHISHFEGIITDREIPLLSGEQMDKVHERMMKHYKDFYESDNEAFRTNYPLPSPEIELTIADDKVTKLEFSDQKQQKLPASISDTSRKSYKMPKFLSDLSKGEKVAFAGAAAVTLGALAYAGYRWYKHRQENKKYSETGR